MIVRSYSASDKEAVMQLLSNLPKLYPGAADWLERTLDLSLEKQATCWLAEEQTIIGIIILKPKGSKLKIANFYVAESARRQGVGQTLLHHTLDEWQNYQEVFITLAPESKLTVMPFLAPYGFQEVAISKDRYRPGYDEIILVRKK